MKRISLFFLLSLVAASVLGQDIRLKGDVTFDNKVDIGDVVAIINVIAGTVSEEMHYTDVNGDGHTDISDVVMVINIIAGIADAAVLEGLCPDNNHPHVIDMGDMGKWSCCNVSASAPWEYGGYYAWGETTEKERYSWDTYTLCKGSSSTCFDLGEDIAGKSFDAAQAVMGGKWCMPTEKQMKLISNAQRHEWCEINGVKGVRITSDNGKSLFFPGGGVKIDDSHWYVGMLQYLTSTLTHDENHSGGYDNSDACAWICTDYRGVWQLDSNLSPFADRCDGYNIRAVVGDTIYPPNDPDDPAVVAGLCPNSYHPHIIDLGSAGQWSCCNVGSSAPWEYGGLYAWGELTTKSEYEWSNYTHCDGSKSTVHYLFRNIAATEYDVASVEWQGKWAMPSYRQLKGLGDLQRERITVNDVSGMKITGSNGFSIFMPVVNRYSKYGKFWSASLQTDDNTCAKCVTFYENDWEATVWHNDQWVAKYDYLCNGNAIRPVRGADKDDPEDIEPDQAAKEHYCPNNNHPHAIDMGSAGKWACCNVGASVPWETGGYYCWGGTKELKFYGATPENETACVLQENYDGNGNDWWGYKWGMWNEEGVLLPAYDVARKLWGGSWHIPTAPSFEKLNNTGVTKEGTMLNGTPGLKITASNGNKIFLPYCGAKVEAEFHYDQWSHMEYWTATSQSTYMDWCIEPNGTAMHHDYWYDPTEGEYPYNCNTDFTQISLGRGVGLPVRAVQ